LTCAARLLPPLRQPLRSLVVQLLHLHIIRTNTRLSFRLFLSIFCTHSTACAMHLYTHHPDLIDSWKCKIIAAELW
jgi:hypothetical protein